MRSTQEPDVLVVGSGASGSFAALELTRQGLSVQIIEAGREIVAEDTGGDEAKGGDSTSLDLRARVRATLRGQHIQARAGLFNDLVSDFYVNDRRHPYTTPREAPYLWFRGRQAGGRLHTYGRVLSRWSDDDFRMFSRTGAGVDWPICHDDLAPYYAEVEELLGICGQSDQIETLPDSVCAHPSRLTEAEAFFKQAVESRDPARRVVARRYTLPEEGPVPKPLAAALATGRLDIRYNMTAREVLIDPDTGQAVGVACIDSVTRKEHVFRASAVVLSASAIESVRLLLNSGPSGGGGLGNSSGMLGRYFADQLHCIAVGTMPRFRGYAETDAASGDPAGIFIPRLLPEEAGGRPRTYMFQGKIARTPVPKDAPSRFTFMGYGQMTPDRDNRVTLDPKRRDTLSIPIPRIRCAISSGDEATLRLMQDALEEMVADAGGELDFIGSPLGLTEMGKGAFPDSGFALRQAFRVLFPRSMAMGSAVHESGGARMGADPRSSVLDPWCRLHDAPNILVTDAAAFPTGGVSGTTLTIMAMTVRACRQLAKDLGSGQTRPAA
ncbi:GMC family oxidoreductase [Roseibacterium beibuensis]|uniref:GMC oxidoreductase n=1 Tax=[Roseibacterium] beibuensis TaxID=1193142 RepID=UPI00217D1629|nr:GMC family oxidoreductase [Roseibacterium beibuensis]MCS6624103.1 GMC family oxidoreductase [Roseibacterium beibuensis]